MFRASRNGETPLAILFLQPQNNEIPGVVYILLLNGTK